MQPGYYLTEFIDTMNTNMRQLTAADAKKLERLCKHVRSATCFQLPVNGILFKDDEELVNTPLDVDEFIRPPFSTIVLEFDFDYPATDVKHAILIVVDTPESTFEDGRKGGVLCIPAGVKDGGQYTVPTFGFTLPYTGHRTWSETRKNWIQYVGLRSFLPDTAQSLAEANNKGDRINDFLQEIFEEEAQFFVRGYLHLCAALALHEVTFTDIAPHKGRNKIRRARGKAPLFTYKVLTIGKKKRKPRNLGGTHASPRSHLRRGYYRTSRNGVRHWVQPCTVKGETPGFVHKDYKVEAEV